MLQIPPISSISYIKHYGALQIKSINLLACKINPLPSPVFFDPTHIDQRQIPVMSLSSKSFPLVQRTRSSHSIYCFQNAPQAQTCNNKGKQFTVWDLQPDNLTPLYSLLGLSFVPTLFCIIQTILTSFNKCNFYFLPRRNVVVLAPERYFFNNLIQTTYIKKMFPKSSHCRNHLG